MLSVSYINDAFSQSFINYHATGHVNATFLVMGLNWFETIYKFVNTCSNDQLHDDCEYMK